MYRIRCKMTGRWWSASLGWTSQDDADLYRGRVPWYCELPADRERVWTSPPESTR